MASAGAELVWPNGPTVWLLIWLFTTTDGPADFESPLLLAATAAARIKPVAPIAAARMVTQGGGASAICATLPSAPRVSACELAYRAGSARRTSHVSCQGPSLSRARLGRLPRNSNGEGPSQRSASLLVFHDCQRRLEGRESGLVLGTIGCALGGDDAREGQHSFGGSAGVATGSPFEGLAAAVDHRTLPSGGRPRVADFRGNPRRSSFGTLRGVLCCRTARASRRRRG